MNEEKHPAVENYTCPKCRNRQSHVREVALAKSGLLDLLPSRDNRYLEVTCMLCGYTEFYNRAIYNASRVMREESARHVPREANQG
ncbi:hypothetical protein JW916_00590 [Candidatus Sumerlaeota bacterium]|nr:hypothetical protein [Candidatus Sumerlaeota bacterium]